MHNLGAPTKLLTAPPATSPPKSTTVPQGHQIRHRTRRHTRVLYVGFRFFETPEGHLGTVSRRIESGEAWTSRKRSKQAIRLSPRDPNRAMWQLEVGEVELETGHVQAAIDEMQKAYEAGYRTYFIYADLAAAYALAGKMDEAKSALAEARRLNSSLTLKWFREHGWDLPARNEGLRKAGLPEE